MNKKDIIFNLRTKISHLREMACIQNKHERIDVSDVVMQEVRSGELDGKPVDRLVLFLRGTGCIDVKKTGGCTFCGFYNATNFNKKISDNSYLTQFERVVNNNDEYPVVCIYNDGSLLCEEEISFTVVKKMLLCLERMPSVKKVVLEAKVRDLSEERIIELRTIFSKRIEIAVGFESANPIIRDYCINKSFSSSVFERAVSLCKHYDVDLIPLMIFKPPFLTEQEAIEDYINSLSYLEQFSLKRIDMEILTIQKGTLAYLLWRQQWFHPPLFWSIVETLKRREQNLLKTPIYISPISYTVSAECMPSNCPDCDPLILERFSKYNECRSVDVFKDVVCECRMKWQQVIAIKPTIEAIPLRVEHYIRSL